MGLRFHIFLSRLKNKYTMAQDEHNLSIFRGFLKFKSNQQKIWGVLIFLSIVTTIEVVLGIVKPSVLMSSFLNMKILNWIFLILTIVKAYYIAWDFMHIRDEKGGLKGSIVLPLVILIPYLSFILLIEADYIFEVMFNGFMSWNF
jgi:cytochrome c oxidase subunit IV